MTECDIYSSADWYEFEEGTLQEQNRDQMKRHLENCPDCQDVYSEVHSLETMLNDAFRNKDLDVPEETEQEIIETANRQAQRRKRTPRDRHNAEAMHSSFAWKEYLIGSLATAATLLIGFVLLTQQGWIEIRETGHVPSQTEEAHLNPSKQPRPKEPERSPDSIPSSSEPRTRQEKPPRPSDPSAEQTNQTEDHTKNNTENPSAEEEKNNSSEDNNSPDRSAPQLVGDVNKDGKVNVIDSMLITKTIMNNKTVDQNVMDVNGDGQVTVQDARYIMKKTMNRAAVIERPSSKTY